MGRRKRRSTGGSEEAPSGGAPKRAQRSARAGGATALRASLAEFPNLAKPESEMLLIDCTLFVVLVVTAVVQHLNVAGFTWQVERVHPLFGLVMLSLLEDFIQPLFDHYARKMDLFDADGNSRGSVLPGALETSKLLGGVMQIVLIWRLFQEHPLHTVFGLAPLLHETVPQMAALVGLASEEGGEGGEGVDRAQSGKAVDDFTMMSRWWSTRFGEVLSRAVVLSYMVAGLPLIFLTADASYDVWRCYTLVYVTFANVLLMSTLLLIVSHGGRLRALAADGGYWRSVHAGASGSSSTSQPQQWDPEHASYPGGNTVRHGGQWYQADGRVNRAEPGKIAASLAFLVFDDPTLTHVAMTALATFNIVLFAFLVWVKPWLLPHCTASLLCQVAVLYCCTTVRRLSAERLLKTAPLGALSLRNVYDNDVK